MNQFIYWSKSILRVIDKRNCPIVRIGSDIFSQANQIYSSFFFSLENTLQRVLSIVPHTPTPPCSILIITMTQLSITARSLVARQSGAKTSMLCVWGNNCVNRKTCSCVIIISLYARNCFVLKKRVCDCLCKWKTVERERERKSKLIICWKIVGFLEENWTSCTCWWTTPRFPFSHLWQVHLNTISEQKLSVSLILSFSSVLIVFSSSFSSSFSSLPLKNLVVTNLLFFFLSLICEEIFLRITLRFFCLPMLNIDTMNNFLRRSFID